MIQNRHLLAAAMLLFFLVWSDSAHAQFGTAAVPRQIETKGEAAKNTFVTAYPLAPFIIDTGGGSQTKYGGLLTLEKGFVQANKRTAETVGAWLWSSGDATIYELHGKYYFNSQFGVQAGFLGAVNVGGHVYDGFVLYNPKLSLGGKNREALHTQIGLGAHGGESTGFTGFLQTTYDLRHSLNLNVSYWYIRETPFDFHRIAVGLGYRF